MTNGGKTKRGKGTKLLVLVEGAGTPLGLHVAAASPAEVTLLDATLATVHVPRAHRAGRPRQRPDRLIADRGYDSNYAASLRRGRHLFYGTERRLGRGRTQSVPVASRAGTGGELPLGAARLIKLANQLQIQHTPAPTHAERCV